MMLLRSLLGLALVLVVAGECPQAFIHLGDECYYFAPEEFNRDEAASFCLILGAFLASFANCSNFIYVSRYLEFGGVETNGRSYWLGASRAADTWVWTDSNTNFAYGVPYWDPFNTIQSDDEQCAVISSDGGFLMPKICTELNLPLCEAPLIKKANQDDDEENYHVMPRIVCPSPFEAVGERCIYLNNDFLNWDDARAACIAIAPGHITDMAVLSDCQVFSAVARHMEEQQGEAGLPDWAWVGARDFEEDGVFRWLNGDYAEPGVPFWCPGQPNHFEGVQKCVMLWGTNLFYGADENCEAIHKSLCEIGF